MLLSTHFTFDEMTFSEAASRHDLKNIPSDAQIENLKWLCVELLEPIRTLVGKPLQITSGFRSSGVNFAIGGSKTSEHMDGRAADFRVQGMTPFEVCKVIEEHLRQRPDDLPINQMIHEFGSWTHVSIAELGSVPKHQLLTAKRVDGKVVYIPGIVV